MATEKEMQLELRAELSRLVASITELSEMLGTMSLCVEEAYLNSDISEAIEVKTLTRDLIARARK